MMAFCDFVRVFRAAVERVVLALQTVYTYTSVSTVVASSYT